MFFEDHNPPHFHAEYGGQEAFVGIETGDVLHGRLPRPAAQIIKTWTVARQAELRENWTRAQERRPLLRIAGPEDE